MNGFHMKRNTGLKWVKLEAKFGDEPRAKTI